MAKKRKPKTIDVRQAIKDQLVLIGKSCNWLAHEQKSVHPSTAKNYLYGQKDTTGRVIGEMLIIVGLTIE